MPRRKSNGRAPRSPASGAATAHNHHIVVENVSPSVNGGQFPAKRTVGDVCVVEADIFRDGHESLAAAVRWRRKGEKDSHVAPLAPVENDRWRGEFPLGAVGRYFFTIEAWTDRWGTWLSDLRKRVKAGQDVASEILEGASFMEKVASHARGADKAALQAAVAALRSARGGAQALEVLESPELGERMERLQPHEGAAVTLEEYEIAVGPRIAEFGAWYEFFPRSLGTLRDAEGHLDYIRSMGFNVVYLPPIHPIGKTKRKGRNNALSAQPGDVGSPWAIGNENGGHTAVEPSLGTIDDFDRFVKAAHRKGIAVALDFAVQCSPDHPWVKEHPEWFYHRPDGSIKYAENPPKKYEDIYPLNFDAADYMSLWQELKNVIDFWISHGVRIFRVDNPHTKPIAFWRWMIGRVHEENPDVIFLAEAFTRPKMMRALARIGFTQSYTYFTWRNSKAELTEYLTELTATEMKEYFRPNFFVNTPDILHETLQHGGRPAFKARLILAATLSPTYGIYSGFELCENEAVAGTEEYLNSEKYEIRRRDWRRPGNISDYIRTVNAARVAHPALQQLVDLTFLQNENPNILAYLKTSGTDAVIVVVNLDPGQAQQAWVRVPPEKIGLQPADRYQVRDLVTDATYVWGEWNYVRLDPYAEPAHLLAIERRS